jgi:hypothetical protein
MLRSTQWWTDGSPTARILVSDSSDCFRKKCYKLYKILGLGLILCTFRDRLPLKARSIYAFGSGGKLLELLLFYSCISSVTIYLICLFLISKFRRVLNFVCRRFGTLCLFHLHRRVGIRLYRWNRQSVPKGRDIKFRRRGITQKKA